MNKIDSLSVVIPCYNDAPSIASVIYDSLAAIKALGISDYEIYCINDGSADNSGAVLESLQIQIPQLRVKTHVANCGYGQTIKELYAEATKGWVYLTPGDAQFPLEDLSIMVKAAQQSDYDLVVGYRYDRQDSLQRKLNNLVYNSLVRLLYQTPKLDINSIKLVRHDVMDSFNLLSSSPFVDTEICFRFVRGKYKVGNIAVEHRAREHGQANGGKLSLVISTIAELFTMWPKLWNSRHNRKSLPLTTAVIAATVLTKTAVG